MIFGLVNLIPERSFHKSINPLSPKRPQLDCNTVGAGAAQNNGGGMTRKRRPGQVVVHRGSNDWSSFLISEY